MSIDKPERVQRIIPKRTAPIRTAATLVRPLHDPEPVTSRGDAPESPGGVERAVENAYKVLDEQLHRGEDAARAYRGGRDRAGGGAGGAGGGSAYEELPRSMIRIWSEAFSLWLDALGPLAPPGLRSVMRGFSPDQSPQKPEPPPAPVAAASSAAWTRVTLGVSSTKPVEVGIELAPHADLGALVVQDLLAFEGGGKPPITGATIEPGADGRVIVRLTVAADQPPGTYLGMILDRTRAEQRGTLRVCVSA